MKSGMADNLGGKTMKVVRAEDSTMRLREDVWGVLTAQTPIKSLTVSELIYYETSDWLRSKNLFRNK
jgi:hypothetical protein